MKVDSSGGLQSGGRPRHRPVEAGEAGETGEAGGGESEAAPQLQSVLGTEQYQ